MVEKFKIFRIQEKNIHWCFSNADTFRLQTRKIVKYDFNFHFSERVETQHVKLHFKHFQHFG